MLAQSSVTFPPRSDHAPPDIAKEFTHRANKSTPHRVLVVDDEPLVRWMVSETLSGAGYKVEEAGDGETTIRVLLEGAAPDLILLDLRLPDSNDLWLLEMVRALAPATPIILMTAFGTPEVRDEAFRLGAYCVLEKPFEIDELDRLVTRAVA
jgi:DNA-binding NtrC family response regulator